MSMAQNGRWPSSRLMTSNITEGEERRTEDADNASETVKGKLEHEKEETDNEDEPELVEMWNKDAPAGPEWNGPRGYEPTRHGDWAKNGRVTDF